MGRKVIAINEFSGEQIVFNDVKEAAHYFKMAPTGIRKAIEKGNLSYKAGSYFDYLYEGEESEKVEK